MKKGLTLAILLIGAIYQGYKELGPTEKVSQTTDQNRISIMTYNVENLFDTKDDPNKNDETFLPLKKKTTKIKNKCKKNSRGHWVKECLETNWTDFQLQNKMKRLATVIKAYKKNGPDILILQEVENKDVLNQFNNTHLGYKNVILLEGPDKRGIDVAILTKLDSFKSPKLHLQKFKARNGFRVKPTRGILEAHLNLPNGEKLSVFGLHFPSQGSPTEARMQSVDRLNSIASSRSHLYIAGGDFNITSSEDKRHKLYSKTLSKKWDVSHLIGCQKCKGSNYYHRKRSWSFLDALLFSKSFGKTWKIDKKSIDVFNKASVQRNKYDSPAKFNMGKDRFGVSDHWPVVSEIYL